MSLPTSTTRRTCLALAAAASLLGLAGGAHGWVYDPVDFSVVDRQTGRVLPVWRHDGRLYVAGEAGARYGIRVTNRTDRRVLVVMSVDGVNILSGETAGWNQRGYIFDPHESYDVNGWRKSNTEVAAFAFAPLSQSYAARTGRPTEVGVIGLAVFDEKAQPPPETSEAPYQGADKAWRGSPGDFAGRLAAPMSPATAPYLAAPSDRAAAAAGASRSMDSVEAERRDERLGTAHGAREYSQITIVPFERATSYPQFTRQIEYDTYAHLVAAGVIPQYRGEDRHPQPFPESPDGGPFVPDPPED